MPEPSGGIAHCEFMLGDTRVYMSDEAPEWQAFAMPEGGTSSNLLCIEVDDCDAAFKQAVEAGAEVITEPTDQFWGSRSAVLKDPFGYRWGLAQMIEEVEPEELMRRAKELFG